MSPFNRPSLQQILILLIVLATVSLSYVAHKKAGFTVPNPWNDESWTLWKAVGFMESNTLLGMGNSGEEQ